MLNKMGIEQVTIASSVAEAVKLADFCYDAGHFDLVLTDYMLDPVRNLNGGEVVMASQCFKDYPTPPVALMVTSNPNEARNDGLVKETLKGGQLKAILQKPSNQRPEEVERFTKDLLTELEKHC